MPVKVGDIVTCGFCNGAGYIRDWLRGDATICCTCKGSGQVPIKPANLWTMPSLTDRWIC
jgi:DnaJ-class molecular chaperone